MKNIFLIISFLITSSVFGQTAAAWENIYGGNGIEYGFGVRSCLGQGYVVAGSTSTTGISDGYLVRVDSLGLVMWSKYYSGANIDIFRSIKILPDSGFIIAGFSNSSGNGGYDGWVMRVDKNGDSLWSKYIGTPAWDFFYDVAATYDGGFILAGGTYGGDFGNEDYYLVKINGNGDTLWTRTYGGNKEDEARGIIQTKDSSLAVVGYSYSLADTTGESWILRLNEFGDTLWTRTIGMSTVEDKCWSIDEDSIYNRIIVAGQYKNATDENAYITGFFMNGNIQFVETFGGVLDDWFTSVRFVPSNQRIVVLGTTYNNGNGGGELFLFDDRFGWQGFTYGTSDLEMGYGVDFTIDGGYIACGFTEGYNSNIPNVYLVKVDTSGIATNILAIRENPDVSEIATTHIYPNPVENEATVLLDSHSPINGELNLELVDVSSRTVKIISNANWKFDTERNASCKIEVSNLNTGVYFYTIYNNSIKIASGKLIIAR